MKTKLLIFLLFIALGTSVTTCQDTSQNPELYAAGRFLILTGNSTVFSSSDRTIQLYCKGNYETAEITTLIVPD